MDAPANAGADSLTIGTCIISSGVLCYISQCEDGFHSACHQRNKQVLCLSCHQSLLLSVIRAPLKPPLSGPSSSWEREVPQIFQLRPLIGPPTVLLPTGYQKEIKIQTTKELFRLPNAGSLKRKNNNNKLIKIQLSLTSSLLPFQSFYSLKSLAISMKLKGRSSRLWNGGLVTRLAIMLLRSLSHSLPKQVSLMLRLLRLSLFSLSFLSPGFSLISLVFFFSGSLVPQFEFKGKKRK